MDQVNFSQSVPAFPTPSQQPFAFSGDRSAFRRLVTRGAGLEIVTLGFYRFWLATDIRRHLWSHTVVDGDAFEYTGRGKELLIGFLVALAILVPIYLAYFLLGLEAERFKAFASIPLIALLYLLGQFATYRARRYRLTRTVWRGVRFWMQGSGWAYALRAALWGVLTLLTLGLALPWRDAALERYKMRHSYYGDLQGSFEGSGWEFFKRGWWLWPVGLIAIVLFPLLPFVYARFKSLQWRWWLSGVRFGGVRLVSTLPRGGLTKLYLNVVGWWLLALLGFAVYLAVCGFGFAMLGKSTGGTNFAAGLQSVPMFVLICAGYLGLALIINILTRLYLTRDLWAIISRTTTVLGLEAADNVAAKGDVANAIGEGFADGLDVAGF